MKSRGTRLPEGHGTLDCGSSAISRHLFHLTAIMAYSVGLEVWKTTSLLTPVYAAGRVPVPSIINPVDGGRLPYHGPRTMQVFCTHP